MALSIPLFTFYFLSTFLNCIADEDYSYYTQFTEGKNPEEIYLDSPLTVGYVINLAKVEIEIYTLLKKHGNEKGLSYLLQRYFSDYDSVSGREIAFVGYKNIWRKATHISKNPNALLRMLLRMVRFLRPVLNELAENSEKELLEDIFLSFEYAKIDQPSEDDILEQMDTMLYMHDFYALDPSETANGKFLEIQTQSFLNPSHLLEIAEFGLEKKFYAQAYFFFKAALRLNSLILEKEFQRENATQGLQRLILEHNNNFAAEGKKEHFFSALLPTNISEQTLPTVDEVNVNKYGGKKELMEGKENCCGDVAHYNLKALCRGDEFVAEGIKRSLVCYLDTSRHPFFLLNPVRTEILSRDPLFLHFHDVFPKKWLINLWKITFPPQYMQKMSLANFMKVNSTNAKEEIENSLVNCTEPRGNVTHRIKSLLFKVSLPDHLLPDHPIEKRIQLLTGLGVLGDRDQLRVNTYIMGSTSHVHHDHVGANDKQTQFDGRRLASFLFFITDVELGGGTAFPYLGFRVKPKMGDGIMWSVSDTSLQPEYRTTHDGCPGIIGHRYTGVRFMREWKNFLRRKCSKDRRYWLDPILDWAKKRFPEFYKG